MGLDMYAYSTETTISNADFDTPDDACEFTRWRKHANLHGWMEQLYRRKGGGAPEFNCVNVKLDPADIDALEIEVLADGLPFTTGFFFGASQPEDKADDLAFIAAARKLFEDGDSVFYSSWW